MQPQDLEELVAWVIARGLTGIAETELLRVGVGPSFAAETANVDGSASASVPLAT